MKREYNRPTVEKLAFNYRNQVVAASGTDSTLPQQGDTLETYYNRLISLGLSPAVANFLINLYSYFFGN